MSNNASAVSIKVTPNRNEHRNGDRVRILFLENNIPQEIVYSFYSWKYAVHYVRYCIETGLSISSGLNEWIYRHSTNGTLDHTMLNFRINENIHIPIELYVVDENNVEERNILLDEQVDLEIYAI